MAIYRVWHINLIVACTLRKELLKFYVLFYVVCQAIATVCLSKTLQTVLSVSLYAETENNQSESEFQRN